MCSVGTAHPCLAWCYAFITRPNTCSTELPRRCEAARLGACCLLPSALQACCPLPGAEPSPPVAYWPITVPPLLKAGVGGIPKAASWHRLQGRLPKRVYLNLLPSSLSLLPPQGNLQIHHVGQDGQVSAVCLESVQGGVGHPSAPGWDTPTLVTGPCVPCERSSGCICTGRHVFEQGGFVLLCWCPAQTTCFSSVLRQEGVWPEVSLCCATHQGFRRVLPNGGILVWRLRTLSPSCLESSLSWGLVSPQICWGI